MENLYDVVIVGGGPAGLTAAIYLGRAYYRVLVIEKGQFGGQIALTEEVVNYPGIVKTTGAILAETMRQQAVYFGVEFRMSEVTEIAVTEAVKRVQTRQGEVQCLALLMATGARPRTVGFKGEYTYVGRGVAYCATCDGAFFMGREVFVIGGGYVAAEESVFLAKFARQVTILIRESDFTCAPASAAEARQHPKIKIVTRTEVEEISGEGEITQIRYRNNETGKVTTRQAEKGDHFGVFVFVGYAPCTELLKPLLTLDNYGYVQADETMATTVPGLYVAGDVRVKPLRQVVTAVGDGALAAVSLLHYVANQQKLTGLKPQRKTPTKSPPIPPSDKPMATTLETVSPFDETLKQQLKERLRRLTTTLIFQLSVDERPISTTLKIYLETLVALTDKLTLEIVGSEDRTVPMEDRPCVRLYRADTWTGLAFHGVPSGHEFSAFIVGIEMLAGSDASIESATHAAIMKLTAPCHIKLLVSASCTLCPSVVIAVQQIAALNPYVTVDIYEISQFETLRKRYQVMSVPCMVLNEHAVTFGKKDLSQVLAWLQEVSSSAMPESSDKQKK